jgi:Cof subfamily protein (haloacid dehalogenase superfamily)
MTQPTLQPNNFDLVILDLDGTILDLYRPAPITPAVCDAIQAVQAKGIPVTIATGRTLDYVRAHIADLGVRVPVVTGQGAVIGDPQTGAVLEETPLAPAAARQAATWIDARDYVTVLYFSQPNGPILIYQNRAGSDPDFYDHVFGAPRTLTPDFARLVAQSAPLKFVIAEEEDRAGDDGLVEELHQTLGAELTITRTHPRLVEGTAAGVDKGAGVRRLCAHLGIDPARVLAIGDSDNDIPMLETVGMAVGMGNASAGVKAVAHWLAPSIDEDGAAVALRRWVLGDGDGEMKR